MPLFEILHAAPLTKAQKDEMALAITELQCRHFGTPRLFVTVMFADTTGKEAYVAGKWRKLKIIHVTFRDGPMHEQAQFENICIGIQDIWSKILHVPHSGAQRHELALGAIYVTGAILTALEAGFIVAKPGKEKEWAMENMEAFKRKSQAGDEDIAGLLEELQCRLKPVA